MHVLIDIGHPAHVHLFRRLALQLQERGDRVTITIRDRGTVGHLLRHYGLPYTVASVPRRGLVGLGLELLIHSYWVLLRSLPDRPDYLIGTSVSIAHVGKMIRRPSIVLNEDDADYVPLFAKLTYPWATYIVTPIILRDRKTAQYRCHASYHELAYLHPNHFTPDATVFDRLGLKQGEPYSIIRLVGLTAHHDVDQIGISPAQCERLVKLLSRYGRVFINGENDLPASLRAYQFRAPPESMHSVLAFSQVLVSDSQTMTMEAAVLGTPAFRCNTFVGRCSVITELENTYQLAWGYHPHQFDEMMGEIDRLLADTAFADDYANRRQKMLQEKIDLTDWLLTQLDRGFR